MNPEREATFARNQRFFAGHVDEWMKDNAGRFVLIHDGALIGFFEDFDTAYREGLQRFGANALVFVARIEIPEPQVLSFSWNAGLVFGT